jgi:anti-sigma-K factor RskA
LKLSANAAQQLAAAYALGTLRGPARRRFEEMARADEALASLMRRWELALAPLAANVPSVEPPVRVWREIESRVARPDTRNLQPVTSPFWRPFGLIAAGLATVLLAFFVLFSGAPRDEPLFVAVLTAQESGPRMVVSMHDPDVLRVKVVKPWKGIEGKSLELWVLPTEGAPRSLGLVPNSGIDTVIRLAAGDARLRNATALAVSLEPAEGSPTKAPTGPVLCSGAIAAVKKA